jgi:2-iminobutanoate/2-iminopropanoate deaminase
VTRTSSPSIWVLPFCSWRDLRPRWHACAIREQTLESAKLCSDPAEGLIKAAGMGNSQVMQKEHVNPSTLFSSLPHGFSQIVVASGRKMAFISGQTAWDRRKNIVGRDSVLEQAKQALRNLKAAMEAAGGTLNDIIALRIYIVNYQAESGAAVGTALREFFSSHTPPASTWIGVSALAVPEFLVEIEATAVLD